MAQQKERAVVVGDSVIVRSLGTGCHIQTDYGTVEEIFSNGNLKIKSRKRGEIILAGKLDVELAKRR